MQSDRRPVEIVLDGVKLHAMRLAAARAKGGPVLVLLHDSLGSVALWRDFPERLAEATGLGVFAYDRRGHGGSDPLGARPRTSAYLHDEAATLARVLESAAIEDAILFGHSDGGSIALLAAAHHPAPVRAVVAEAAHVFVEERTLEGIRAAQRAVAEGDLLARLTRHHGPKAEALLAAWMGTWLSPGFRGWNIEDDLRRIRCPVLVVQGDLDEYGTSAQVKAIARGVAGPARTLVLAGVRHTPHRESPAAVLEAVTELVAGAAAHSSSALSSSKST
jgi:pimeloyl-ACP methyl ester carboxylesterase